MYIRDKILTLRPIVLNSRLKSVTREIGVTLIKSVIYNNEEMKSTMWYVSISSDFSRKKFWKSTREIERYGIKDHSAHNDII